MKKCKKIFNYLRLHSEYDNGKGNDQNIHKPKRFISHVSYHLQCIHLRNEQKE